MRSGEIRLLDQPDADKETLEEDNTEDVDEEQTEKADEEADKDAEVTV